MSYLKGIKFNQDNKDNNTTIIIVSLSIIPEIINYKLRNFMLLKK